MRESAAEMGGDPAQAAHQGGTGQTGRLITADSFRMLIARLGARPAAAEASGDAAAPLPPWSLEEPAPPPLEPEFPEAPAAEAMPLPSSEPEPTRVDPSEPSVPEDTDLSVADDSEPREAVGEHISEAPPIVDSEPAAETIAGVSESVESDWSSFVAPPSPEPSASLPQDLAAAIHSSESWDYWLENDDTPEQAAAQRPLEAETFREIFPPDGADSEPVFHDPPLVAVEPSIPLEGDAAAHEVTEAPPDPEAHEAAAAGDEPADKEGAELAPVPVFTIDLDAEPQSPDLQWPDLVGSLSERLGSGATLLKRVDVEADPFAQPAQPAQGRRPSSFDIADPDQGSEDVARSLLAIMSAPSGASQPQERALAADTLLRLAPRLPVRALIAVAERVSVMESPPPLLIGLLLRDTRDEVAGPLLERASMVSDQDLFSVIAEGDVAKQRMIARRRIISPALADALVATGELAVLLTLLRNPGAALSQDAFARLCALAREHSALQAPLATRADTPAPIAFELFWTAPPELRRFVLSRFLTDSETLDKILKITLAVDGETLAPAEARLPPKQRVDELIALIERGDDEAAVALLRELGNICEANARRILEDRQGEPLTIMFKALGLSRGRLGEVLERLRATLLPRLNPERAPGELQAIFDTLSLNKARVVLTYWDWAAQTTGPYAHLAA